METLKDVYYFFWRLWEYHFKPSAIKRHIKHFYQHITRGYSDKQCWSLDRTFAKFVIPRLKTLKSLEHSYSSDFSEMKEWHKTIDKMIWSFEFVLTAYGNNDYDSDDVKGWRKKYNEGMHIFAKYYWSLWD